jgi:leucine dehydrogenase
MMKIGKHFLLCFTSILLVFAQDSLKAQSDEEKVGRAAAAQVLGAAGLINTEASQQYLNLLGQSLAAKGDAVYRWRFGVIESNAINAFAMPGGYILVSTGLLKNLENEDELAFILAHEIAHVSRRHHYQVILRQRLAEQASKELQSAVQGDEIYSAKADIFAPCALGAILNDNTIPMLQVEIVCGGANNQLHEPEKHGAALEKRGILYAPDFVANAGGVINVYGEVAGWTRERALRKADEIYETVLGVYKIAKDDGLLSYDAADKLAERRIAAVHGMLRTWPQWPRKS